MYALVEISLLLALGYLYNGSEKVLSRWLLATNDIKHSSHDYMLFITQRKQNLSPCVSVEHSLPTIEEQE